MNKEVELKCWITPQNSEKIQKFLENEAVFLGKKWKKDRNFKIKGGENMIAFRLREEKSEDANGNVEGKKFWVTEKTHHYSQNGVEMNDELEFEISSGEAFEALMISQGFEVFYTKEKNVEQYRHEISGFSVLLEKAEVPGLGDFLEIEIVCEEKFLEKAEETIYSYFKNLELEKDIEKKPYIVLWGEGV